jgi:hypothetical protein
LYMKGKYLQVCVCNTTVNRQLAPTRRREKVKDSYSRVYYI